jgi:hypothetical protein
MVAPRGMEVYFMTLTNHFLLLISCAFVLMTNYSLIHSTCYSLLLIQNENKVNLSVYLIWSLIMTAFIAGAIGWGFCYTDYYYYFYFISGAIKKIIFIQIFYLPDTVFPCQNGYSGCCLMCQPFSMSNFKYRIFLFHITLVSISFL